MDNLLAVFGIVLEVVDGVNEFSTNCVRDSGSVVAGLIQGIADLPAAAIQETTHTIANIMTGTAAAVAGIGDVVGLPQQFIREPTDSISEIVRDGGAVTAIIIRDISDLPAVAVREITGFAADVMVKPVKAATETLRAVVRLPEQVKERAVEIVHALAKDIAEVAAETFIDTAFTRTMKKLRTVLWDNLNLVTHTVVVPLGMVYNYSQTF
ncbi:hypothetical protein F5884DRAFT_810483 [Xylogone sp. PMI_703]|nr:hypothetical protein F5884DRAFT_810483 [Xylogone sp. PMI_703]